MGKEFLQIIGKTYTSSDAAGIYNALSLAAQEQKIGLAVKQKDKRTLSRSK